MSRAQIISLSMVVFALTLVMSWGNDAAAVAGLRDRTAREIEDTAIYERAARWNCDVESKFLCFEDVCRRFSVAEETDDGVVQLRYWMELDFESHTYARCDQNGCNTNEVGTSTVAGFTLIEPGSGAFMKIANDSGEFVDVATMGIGLATSFGACTPINE